MKIFRTAMLILLSMSLFSCAKDEQNSIRVRNASRDTVGSFDNYQVSSGELRKVSSREAAKFIGDSLTVAGYIADVFESEKVVYLNFEKKFPRNVFTCTIFAGNAGRFGELKLYKGKNVEVTGKVTSYKNKPQMILWSEAQIKILQD